MSSVDTIAALEVCEPKLLRAVKGLTGVGESEARKALMHARGDLQQTYMIELSRVNEDDCIAPALKNAFVHLNAQIPSINSPAEQKKAIEILLKIGCLGKMVRDVMSIAGYQQIKGAVQPLVPRKSNFDEVRDAQKNIGWIPEVGEIFAYKKLGVPEDTIDLDAYASFLRGNAMRVTVKMTDLMNVEPNMSGFIGWQKITSATGNKEMKIHLRDEAFIMNRDAMSTEEHQIRALGFGSALGYSSPVKLVIQLLSDLRDAMVTVATPDEMKGFIPLRKP